MDTIVPLRALENHVYCRRQCAIIHGDGIWRHNEHTVKGVQRHRRVDSEEATTERGKRVLRSLPLWSETLGLTGRADVVELVNGQVIPVEHKAGTRHGDAADIQLCGQALCLEEMLGVVIPVGFVWYGGPRRRWRVDIDEPLRARTKGLIEAIRFDIEGERLPPAVNDPRCDQCQLRHHCLPEVVCGLSGKAAHLFRSNTEGELFSCDI